jgi:hypothetical protein
MTGARRNDTAGGPPLAELADGSGHEDEEKDYYNDEYHERIVAIRIGLLDFII